MNPYSGDVMLDAFSTDAEYTNYLKHSPYMKLAKNTLKLFPNTPVSLELSKIARAKYGAYEKSKYLTGRSDTEVDTSATSPLTTLRIWPLTYSPTMPSLIRLNYR